MLEMKPFLSQPCISHLLSSLIPHSLGEREIEREIERDQERERERDQERERERKIEREVRESSIIVRVHTSIAVVLIQQ